MGGLFSPTQAPAPQVIGGTPPALGPFQEQLVRAIASMFPGQGGVSPLEESTIRGSFQQAQPIQQMLDQTTRGQFLPQSNPFLQGAAQYAQQTEAPGEQLLQQQASGAFLPGTQGGQSNPFLASLMQGLESQGDIARRQLGASAQRAGALSSTDYLNQSANLESQLAGQRGQTLAGLYEAERGRQAQSANPLLQLGTQRLQNLQGLYEPERQRQFGSVSPFAQLGQSLMGMAQQPRQVAEQAQYRPLDYGLNLLSGGAGRSQTYQPQQGPSPFASLLSGLAPFVGLFG